MNTNYRRDPYETITARLRVQPEGPADDLRNALAILVAYRSEPLSPQDNAAVRARIDSALTKMGT